MQSVLSLILGGGRGTRLYPLTKLRSKPAVSIAGKYRLIVDAGGGHRRQWPITIVGTVPAPPSVTRLV